MEQLLQTVAFKDFERAATNPERLGGDALLCMFRASNLAIANLLTENDKPVSKERLGHYEEASEILGEEIASRARSRKN